MRPFILIGDAVITIIVIALAVPVWFLPQRQAIALARGYGYLAAALWLPGRRIATINLIRAYGDALGRRDVDRIAWGSFASIAQSIAEKMQIVRRYGRQDPPVDALCEFEDPEMLARFREPGPRLFVQAHFGSWEV